MNPIYYAGVGSRDTPPDVLELMTKIARSLKERQYTLRTGGASGADMAFWRGSGMNYEIYIPKENKKAEWPSGILPSKAAFKLASKLHPAWKSLSEYNKLLHARNVATVLGVDLATPVDFVMCWTPDGAVDITTEKTGGTGMAIRTAYANGIHVYNLQRPKIRAEWERLTTSVLRDRDEAQQD